MFRQNRNKFWLPNKLISSLPPAVLTTLRTHSASLQKRTINLRVMHN